MHNFGNFSGRKMNIEPTQLRKLMRKWASGVTLVTVRHGSEAHGMTVSSFTSISLDPPLILVSLEKDSRTHGLVRKSGRFAVSILANQQVELAERFAGRIPDQNDRTASLKNKTELSEIPIPSGSLAYLECEVIDSKDAGTHTLFIAQVIWEVASEGGQPLLYYDQDYRVLS
jgi:flavin reductase (DIM6/NTAB) family NADH-FMN oxidoreductase RutF